MVVQRDYGGFDSAFFGVTLRLSGATDYDLYRKLRLGETFPVEGHYQEDELCHVLQLATVASHEIRHFHDSLISPYGALAVRARVGMALNWLQLLDQILNSGANCLPFPMSRWCRLSDKARGAQKKEWGKPPEGAAWVEVPLPHITPAMVRELDTKKLDVSKEGKRAIKSLILAGHWYRNKLDALSSDRCELENVSIESWEIFELSALLVQIADVAAFENKRGYRWPARFADYIMKTESNRYGEILRLVARLGQSLGEPFVYRANLICQWSLLGAHAPRSPEESPARRFAALWRHVRKHGFPAGDDPGAIFALWSKELKLSTPNEGLERTRTIIDALRKAIADAAAYGALLKLKWKEEFHQFRCYIEQVASASDHLRTAVLRDPQNYVDPYRYLKHHNDFPNMIIRTMVDGFVAFPDNEDPTRDVDHIEERDGGPMTILTEMGVASPHTFVTLEQSIAISSLIAVCDLFFRDSFFRLADAQRMRRMFEEERGVRLREVLV